MSYLFIKKSLSKRKVCIAFIKNKKFKKPPKKPFLVGFSRWFYFGFLGGFFIANPALKAHHHGRWMTAHHHHCLLLVRIAVVAP